MIEESRSVFVTRLSISKTSSRLQFFEIDNAITAPVASVQFSVQREREYPTLDVV
jgi:hypothetical protein